MELGANGLAHIWRKDSTEITNAEIALLKERGVFIIPTLFVYKKAVKKAGWNIDLELQKKDLLRLHKAGIPILAGTDPPNFGINYGSDLVSEIELLVESGLSEIEALKAATSSISRSFKLGQNGFIKQEFSADFVLINGDPTKNISDLHKINGVWKKGRWITPED